MNFPNIAICCLMNQPANAFVAKSGKEILLEAAREIKIKERDRERFSYDFNSLVGLQTFNSLLIKINFSF